MTTVLTQLEAVQYADTKSNDRIEALQVMLARKSLEVSYEEARELGYELVVFFTALEAPGKEEESHDPV